MSALALVARAGQTARCAHCGSVYEVAPSGAIEADALRLLAGDLAGASEDCWRFVRALWRPGKGYGSAKEIAVDLAVEPSTLMSRFYRLGLPSPKRYLVAAQLTRAARLFEDPRTSVLTVAEALSFSSPQAFGRHVRQVMGLTPLQFRSRWDGAAMLRQFRTELILPYREQLMAAHPLIETAATERRVS